MILCGMMLLVAIRVGCSIWLTNWLAASKPSWKELRSIEVSRGEVRRAKQRIIKGNDGQIARNGDAPECAEPLQRHREDVVADDDSGRAILPLDERVQRASCISSACISMQSSA